MKILILFFLSGVLCELPVETELTSLEPETLTDLPFEGNQNIEVLEHQNDVEIQLDEEDNGPVEEEGLIAITPIPITEKACTEKFMEWLKCGPRCYQTCVLQPRGARRTERAVCETISSSGCYPGCYCKSGYVRLNKSCVKTSECPTRSCLLPNEDYRQCGTACVITCDNHYLAATIEEKCMKLCVRGCFCKDGYVRNAGGFCVLPNRCPRPLFV